jgi:WD40 repeat protein
MRFLPLIAAVLLSAALSAQEPKKDLPPIPTVDLKRATPVEYGADIEPIFKSKCFVCHTGNVTEGKFDMSTHEKVLKGGAKRGAKVVVPGKSAESFLFKACARETKPIMPPKTEEPLSSQELSLVKLWIDEGAKAPTTTRAKEKIIVSLPAALVRPVRAVVVSPDGKSVVASRGNRVNVFEVKAPADTKKADAKKDWAHERELIDLEIKSSGGKAAKAAHVSLVESMAFSPDGKTLATGSFQELTLWDFAKGIPIARIGGFADKVTCIAYSQDGEFFATGGGAPTEDGEIKIFTAQGKLVADVKNGHSDTVFGVAFSPDRTLLATCGADKFVKVFELPHEGWGWPFGPGPKSVRLAKSFEGHTHHVMGVGWTPDGKRIASCGADNFVKVWDYEKGEKVRDMQGHQKQVTSLHFVGKTPQFLTGSGDATVRMWNADNGGTVRNFPGAADFIYSVSASPDGTVVATGCEDGIVRVYNGANAQLQKAAVPPDAEPKKDEAPKKK